MHLGNTAVLAQHAPHVDGNGVRQLLQDAEGYGWLDSALESIWGFLSAVAATLASWFAWLGPPIAWTFHVLYIVVAFVQSHPFSFHILGWTIFFGPIILLLPALLLLEMFILMLFYSTFLLHGFHTGMCNFFLRDLSKSLETRFEILKDRFIDWRESLFATVEIWTSYVNRWTTDYPALLVLRVLAGAMSSYLLVGIWISWSSTGML
ncbi:hypothetical protein D9619_013129 [Psilocybe cf. subviscida]|uniref:Uncharacterized protein n=1 Tax=Psilocybe cf. subviscida TaxID=2480587 RepID=A0A8H5EZ14_9AGAR|nr:hypothetical protein D9619_013129 [Psilocybe cf. subviscida]